MEPNFEALPRPTLARNLGFWLVAVLLGAVLLLLATLFYTPFHYSAPGQRNTDFTLLLLVALLSAGLSVAALPLLLPTLPWALAASSVPGRWGRLGLLQGVVLGLLIALASWWLKGDESARIGWVAGPVFSVGGLLAARLVYAAWL